MDWHTISVENVLRKLRSSDFSRGRVQLRWKSSLRGEVQSLCDWRGSASLGAWLIIDDKEGMML